MNVKENVSSAKNKLKSALTKDKLKGTLSNVFNTLAFKKGWKAGLAGYASVAFVGAAAFVGVTGGAALGVTVVPLAVACDLASSALAARASCLWAKQHDKKKALTV